MKLRASTTSRMAPFLYMKNLLILFISIKKANFLQLYSNLFRRIWDVEIEVSCPIGWELQPQYPSMTVLMGKRVITVRLKETIHSYQRPLLIWQEQISGKNFSNAVKLLCMTLYLVAQATTSQPINKRQNEKVFKRWKPIKILCCS